jgi:hypothetical protein
MRTKMNFNNKKNPKKTIKPNNMKCLKKVKALLLVKLKIKFLKNSSQI